MRMSRTTSILGSAVALGCLNTVSMASTTSARHSGCDRSTKLRRSVAELAAGTSLVDGEDALGQAASANTGLAPRGRASAALTASMFWNLHAQDSSDGLEFLMDESKMDIDDVPQGHPLQVKFAEAVDNAADDAAGSVVAFQEVIAAGVWWGGVVCNGQPTV